jgi:DNA-binding transcriptional ArsR family regulator
MPFPFSGPTDVSGEQEGELRVLGVDDARADAVFEALSSSTARSVLAAVYETPGTASELAERTDHSLQTATYHLDALEAADLIRVADTQYSEKGTEMDIYAPPEDPVIVFVGTKERRRGFLDLFKRLIGATAILILVAAWIFTTYAGGMLADGGGRSSVERLVLLPGVEFLMGGLLILALIVVWWFWSR